MLNVYLSSPFLELKERRQEFLKAMEARDYLYNVKAMEFYRAEDENILAKCKSDVNECDIYVCIIGSSYGTPARDEQNNKTTKSYTHWEFITANERKARGENIERLILIKREETTNPDLIQWRQEVNDLQILPAYYVKDEEIPQLILQSLDNCTARLLERNRKKIYIPPERRYQCNREEQKQAFERGRNKDPIQFFLLKGHNKDLLPHFIKRQELEYKSVSREWRQMNIKLERPPGNIDLEYFESAVQIALYNTFIKEEKWGKAETWQDVTIPDSLMDFMADHKCEVLCITWAIDSAYWKNPGFHKIMTAFFEKYDNINKELSTSKRIFFFGLLNYTDDPECPEETFYEQTKNISWENNLPKFRKINKQDIKEWLELIDDDQPAYQIEQIMDVYFKTILNNDMYYHDLEKNLLPFIQSYNPAY